MNPIYEPTGHAREYARWALNLRIGCRHGCLYCYGPAAAHKSPRDYAHPSPRLGILDSIQRQARHLTPRDPHILMSFLTDPYQPNDYSNLSLTRLAIQVLKEAGLRVAILTKAGLPSLRDIDILTPQDQYAATLTCIDASDSLHWEPRAALPLDRMFALKAMHDRGIPTWVSLEPILNTRQAVQLIAETHEYVDEYRIGPMNHQLSPVDLNDAARQILSALQRFGCAWYWKNAFLPYLPPGTPQNSPKPGVLPPCPP